MKDQQNSAMQRLHGLGILPTVTINDPGDASALAHALARGGLPAVEISMRTEEAHDAIAAMRSVQKDMLIGAGEVRTKAQAEAALDAGADFITSPNMDPDLLQWAETHDLLLIPGASSPAEIAQAQARGLKAVRLFPAEPLGGIPLIRSLSAACPEMAFLPAGGIPPERIPAYLEDPAVLAVSTARIACQSLVACGTDRIEQLAREAVQAMLGLHVRHVGVNAPAGEDEKIAASFASLLCGTVQPSPKGWFGSDMVEVMREGCWKGSHGHIGIGVHSLRRAMAYYEAIGMPLDRSTLVLDEHGEPRLIYFQSEIAGFAIHLVRD